MPIALQKTLAFLLLIGIGLLLRKKIANKDQLHSAKMLILSVALPAMIFVALLKADVQAELVYLPLLALLFNFLLLLFSKYIFGFMGIDKDSATARTLLLLFPSLAPGLSCFPYVLEYLGEDMLAWAALADVGNKVFVLIILYMLAMQWYYRRRLQPNTVRESKLKQLIMALLNEPVNLVILAALLMVSLGLHIDALPVFVQDAVERLSAMMTPLVLLFIGLAVSVKRTQIGTLLSLLFWRSGLTFLLSAGFILLLPESTPVAVLLLVVVFPQSSVSFWPFAHMSAVSAAEEKDGQHRPTFDLDLGIALLAFSLPFSTLVILAILSAGNTFAAPMPLSLLGGGLLLAGALPMLRKKRQKGRFLRKKSPSVAVAEEV